MLCLLGPSNAGRMSSSNSATSPQQHQASSADSTPAAATSPAAAPPPSPPPAYIPQPAAPQVRSQPRQRRDAQPPVAAVADRAAQFHSQRIENLKKEHGAKNKFTRCFSALVSTRPVAQTGSALVLSTSAPRSWPSPLKSLAGSPFLRLSSPRFGKTPTLSTSTKQVTQRILITIAVSPFSSAPKS